MTPQGYLLILFLIAVCIEFILYLYKSTKQLIRKVQGRERMIRYGMELLKENLEQDPEPKAEPEDAVPIDKRCLTKF